MPYYRTVAVANQKGGVGKSTTAINLSAALASKGYKVLIIDMDPQGHSTLGLNIDTRNKKTIAEMLLAPDEDHHIFMTDIKNLCILPSDISLAAAELRLSSHPAKEFRLRRSIEKIHKDFDYIIIDCPPTFGTLAINAFVAARHIILPVVLGYFCLEGTNSFIDTLNHINANVSPVVNHRVDILGVLITMANSRTKIARDIQNEMNSIFSDKLFKTSIPQNVKLNEAQAEGKSIFDHAPESSGASAYQLLCDEFLERIKHVKNKEDR